MSAFKETISNLASLVAEIGVEDYDYSTLMKRNRTNAIPESGHERSQMNLLVDEATADLERCERAISELEEQLGKLKKCRIELVRTRIAPRKSLLSPIRKLPPEILCLIFANVDRKITLLKSKRLRSAVFGLTWVCAHWRALVLSERQMWTGEYEMNLFSPKDVLPGSIEFMKECFQVRARNAPADVTLLGHATGTPALFFTSVLGFVFQSLERWRKFSFEGDALALEYLHKSMSVAGRTNLPYLESFTMLLPATGRTRGREVLRTLQHCPRLRHLHSPYLDPSDICDMKNLTSLKVARCKLTRVLMQCPLLKKLVVYGSVSQVPGTDYPDYHHTHLSRWDMKLADCRLKKNWSAGLHLPALTHLSLDPIPRDDSTSCQALQEMAELLIRSKCSLQKIKLNCRRITEEDRDRFLRRISSATAPGALIKLL
ncbi:hypothetical protein D9757_009980 [Collybiopsis confluens]|uniref:F-box domain-containing protein n=1 Tax=Collybiopsis confluens TaxID=2823264 RepID=A0A8H5LW24_9AGAR|nr:hypothetical protein D9757_009980 [Collybiopsis confluens]